MQTLRTMQTLDALRKALDVLKPIEITGPALDEILKAEAALRVAISILTDD